MWPFKYPYTNFHELNLDWIINQVKEDNEAVKNIPNLVKKEVNYVFESGAIPVNHPPRKILYIGDSYMLGTGGDGDDIPKMVAESTPVEKWWNYAVGGTGFVRNPNNSSYINQLKKALSELGEEAKEVTDIVVGGTYNDVYYVLTGEANGADFFLPYIVAFRDYCTSNFKNAKLHVFPGMYNGIRPGENIIKIWQYMRSACKKAGVAHDDYCINWLLGYDESVDGDDVHPSAHGYRIIGKNIAQILNGGEVNTNRKISITSQTFTGSVTITYFNDFAEYYFNFQPTSAMSSSITIAEIPDRYMRRSHEHGQAFLLPYGDFDHSSTRFVTLSGRNMITRGDSMDATKTYIGTYIEPMYYTYDNLP